MTERCWAGRACAGSILSPTPGYSFGLSKGLKAGLTMEDSAITYETLRANGINPQDFKTRHSARHLLVSQLIGHRYPSPAQFRGMPESYSDLNSLGWRSSLAVGQFLYRWAQCIQTACQTLKVPDLFV
jgi:hypothetical protein